MGCGFLLTTTNIDLITMETQEKIKTYTEPIENKHFQHFTLSILIISLKKLLIKKTFYWIDEVCNQNGNL